MSNPKPFLLLLAIAAMLAPCAARAVEIIGHRGASHDAPENTLAAFRLAWEQGADAAEVDIWLSKDKRIVALHDKTTKRTTGTDWVIADRPLAELKTLDAGRWKGERFAGERLPVLEEVLEVVPPGKRLFIEIKCGAEVLPHLERVLAESGKSPRQVVLIAFDFDVITAAKKRMPRVKAYWLYGTTPKVDKETGKVSDRPEELLARCRAAGLDGLDLKYDSALGPEFIQQLRAAGLGLYVWTVNEPEVAIRLARLGVDGITTDRPGWLREQLAAGGK